MMPCASSRSSAVVPLCLFERLRHELGGPVLLAVERLACELECDDRLDETLLRPVVQIANHPPALLVGRRHHPCPRGGELGLASPQFGCPLGHLHLELVSGLAKLFFRPPPLMDQAGVRKCCRGVIRSEGKQQLVNLGGKVGTFGDRSNHTALGIDTDGNDNTAAWLDAAADVGNHLGTLRAGRSSAR